MATPNADRPMCTGSARRLSGSQSSCDSFLCPSWIPGRVSAGEGDLKRRPELPRLSKIQHEQRQRIDVFALRMMHCKCAARLASRCRPGSPARLDACLNPQPCPGQLRSDLSLLQITNRTSVGARNPIQPQVASSFPLKSLGVLANHHLGWMPRCI